ELEIIDEPEGPAAVAQPAPAPEVVEEPAPAPAQGGDMPSIAESLEDMDISELATPASIFARPPQPGALAAIPVSNAYAAAIVENGFLSPEKRWLIAIRAAQPVPAVPVLYKVG
ncbi:MAG: hypothetical protein J6333_01515, partial [Planctomycetes bacterium]|nr:hypothetical protein [Planctomycetota bacterium]